VIGAGRRQPAHVLYGGAHLFRADAAARLGALARASFAEHAPDPRTLASAIGLGGSADHAAGIHARVGAKLREEPIEDLRIDFEDGFGVRSDAEEDEAADAVGVELARGLAAGSLPAGIGIRVRALAPATRGRAERTLERVLRAVVAAQTAAGTATPHLPPGFVVTLPKVESTDEPARLADRLDRHERELGLPAGTIAIEIMVETPRAIVAQDGTCPLRGMVEAARGRCVGAHFGTYDYTAACGIAASHQTPDHPACHHARSVMQVALAGTGVSLADGATTVLPVPVHRGAGLDETQRAANRAAIHAAWRAHVVNIQDSMRRGFWQSWDLHPAQLPARWAAVFDMALRTFEATSARLRVFVDRAARATLTGGVFDDAATGQGLLNEVRQARACGALTDDEVLQGTGLGLDDLRLGTFAELVARRRAG
jgi:citrate lyase beta subunit